jgi:hypothetical protein
MYHDRGFAGLPEKQHPSLRDRMRSHRARKYGLFPQRLLVSRTQLDKLEERGDLDPDRRGDRADEAEAIETFLMDALTKR